MKTSIKMKRLSDKIKKLSDELLDMQKEAMLTENRLEDPEDHIQPESAPAGQFVKRGLQY